MKRTELTAGQEVEVKNIWGTAVVVDTRPWQTIRIRRSSGYGPSFGPTDKGQGVAIAERVRQRDLGTTGWLPRVVTLSQLRPVGTRQAERDAREADRLAKLERHNEAQAIFERRRVALAAALGLDLRLVEHRGTSIVLLPEAVDELLRGPLPMSRRP